MKQSIDLFKALADETRLRILALLLSHEELCVCDLIAALKLPQPTVSRHLAYLRKTCWVSDRRCGPWIYYSLEGGRVDSHAALVDFLRSHLASLPEVVADRKQLDDFGAGSGCA
jgi:ArsR family transcriptional regulator